MSVDDAGMRSASLVGPPSSVVIFTVGFHMPGEGLVL